MSDLNEFLADVKHEGTPLADVLEADEETNTPSESQPENQTEVDEPKAGDSTPEENNVPFHQNPRWQQMHELASRVPELERELAELREQSSQKHEPTDIVVPESFKRLYGDDPGAYQAWREEQIRLKEELKEELIREQQEAEQQAIEENNRNLKYIEDQFGRLEAEGRKFNRNELGEIMIKYTPTDSSGNLDFEKGYELYEILKAPQDTHSRMSHARKQIADAASSTSQGEAKKKDYQTPSDLRNKSWHELTS